MHDVIIVGGGPAGLTAGLYAARAGMKAVLLEGELIGGQASTTNMLENYPGYPEGIGGPELMMRFQEQAQKVGLEVAYQAVRSVNLSKKWAMTRNSTYEARAMILATGAKRRKLGVPGEDMLVGRGISYCATCDGALYRGKHVAIVGGGATAIEDALYLTGIGCRVTLIHRRDALRADARMVERVLRDPAVEMCWNAVVNEVKQTDSGIDLVLRSVKTDQSLTVSCAGCFVAIGTEPTTALFQGQVAMDLEGYIEAGEDTRTNVPGVFAAGDLRKKHLRQVVTAVSDGAVASAQALLHVQRASDEGITGEG